MSEEKIIEVACGVLIREDGAVLIGSRPEGKSYAGYWEFPGGKLEDGETVGDALKREFREELDMTVNSSFPWFVTEHRYEHGHVRLHFYRSRDFRGTPVCREGQKTVWMHPGERPPGLMLPKDGAIMNRVALPDVWEDRVDTLTYSTQAFRATVERDRRHRFVGARLETMDDLYKAVALDYDFGIVAADRFDEFLVNGEALLPLYAEGARAADLDLWQARGAHGVKP